MAIPASNTSIETSLAFAIHDQPLAAEIADYLGYLAAQCGQSPITLTIKIHPLNIAESFAHELETFEKKIAVSGEKKAAKELVAHHVEQNINARHELADLIAEITSPLADATLAHHLLFVIAFGKDLTPPYAIDRMGICATFDSKHGSMNLRFAPGREIAPPINEKSAAAGMTFVCEPLETGYYRLPDDKRHRNASGLLMSDPLYRWTMRAITVYFLALAYNAHPGASERETLLQVARQMRSLFRLLALRNPDKSYMASLGGLSLLPQLGFTPSEIEEIKEMKERQPVYDEQSRRLLTPKIVSGRYAGTTGTVQARNVEHRAGTAMTERHQSSLHHPLSHSHTPGPEMQPE